MYRRDDFLLMFPENIKYKVKEYLNDGIQEVRIKVNKPVIIYLRRGEVILNYTANIDDLKYILKRISSYSLYAYEEEIKRGFITIKGGHRVGLAGECVMSEKTVRTIKNISSINLRITREIFGCSKKLIPYLIQDNRVLNTIIVSPPKCGKTTILRDLTRVLSNGDSINKLTGKKVVVIDERSEIGACYEGIPQMDVGIRTDILDNCYKREGILMAVRALAPEVIICDEIGREEEIEEIKNAFNSGVNLIFSVHGKDFEDLYKRDGIDKLLSKGLIDRVVVLASDGERFGVEKVYSRKSEGEFRCLNIY
ncbi:stage III sporulation protein AA [uncultured Clostridium sp.]|uniref:stage III sporulation protein AA n=1 Tax=uncultured Clostridium sp. TaxID=59620 RepID=UPI00262BA4D8|nr:stage III sporulation protein AA [uncultured Clostridium sp.]